MKKVTLTPKRRSLAFQQRARERAARQQNASADQRPPSAAPRAAEPLPPRAILTQVKERARKLPEPAPVPNGVAAGHPAAGLTDSLRDAAADVLTARDFAGSDQGLTAKEREIRRHLHVKRCPKCRHSVALAHRHRFDKLVASVVPVHRWECGSCGWTGLRLDRHELKRIKRRVGVVVIVVLAFLIGLALMWFFDYLKYTYHPSEREPAAESGP